MTHLYFKFMTGFLILLVTLAISARVFGAHQPTNPALRGFVEGCADKPQPCWYGIVPGVTNYDEAKHQLALLNYKDIAESSTSIFYHPSGDTHDACLVFLSNMDRITGSASNLVQDMTFRICSRLQAGDIMALWGKPERVTVGVSYGEGVIIATTTSHNAMTWNVSLFEPLSTMGLTLPKLAVTHRTQWHGFAPKWRYCQLEPLLPGCNY